MSFEKMRKKIGTQAEVSRLLSVSQQSVAGWERGLSYPRRKTLKEIARLFGITEGDVLTSIDNSKGNRRHV